MKLSAKAVYGMLAMVDLAIHKTSGHVHKDDIAKRQEIPEQYLSQVLAVLRRAGFVTSFRGPFGGHTLAKNPSEIRIGDLLELLDGPQTTEIPKAMGEQKGRVILRQVFDEADRAAAEVLSRVTLEQLAENWRRSRDSYDYAI